MRWLLSILVFIPLILTLGSANQAQVTPVLSAQSGNWSSPLTWVNGIVPPQGSTVTIIGGHVITYDSQATIAGLTIESGAELRFAPNASATLNSTGNIIVSGTLAMKPSTPVRNHLIKFLNVNESAFVGGGMSPVASDVGLWVMDGKLDLAGASKTAWTRAAGDIALGATQVELEVAPQGWQLNDVLVIAPTEHPSVGDSFWWGFEIARVVAVNGTTVTLNHSTIRAHPAVGGYGAEVLNLTRNVQIEGTGQPSGTASVTANGRAHIFIRSNQAQSIKYVALRYLGPRAADGNYTKPRSGRYALHFHHSGDGSRGSIIEGVAARDIGNRVYVPHTSHGITFRDSISYNNFEAAVWWDAQPCNKCGDEQFVNDSNDILFDRMVVALVKTDSNDVRLTAYSLQTRTNLTLTNSVAVGVQGRKDSSGFHWPESGSGVWMFRHNVAHNNKADGIFVWQNNTNPHVIEDYAAYHNGGFGIDHGSYGNRYQYIGVDLIGNTLGGINSRAASIGPNRPDGYAHAFERIRMDNAFRVAEHNLPYSVPTLVKFATMSHIIVDERDKPIPGQYDFVHISKPDGASIEPSDFHIAFAWPESVYRVQRADGTAYQVSGSGAVTDIEPFYSYDLPPQPFILSERAEVVRWLLATYPDLYAELVAAGVIR